MKLVVDFVVLTASDEGRSEVLALGLSSRRQAGRFQVVVETLHLISWLLWKNRERSVGYSSGSYGDQVWFQVFTMNDFLLLFFNLDQRVGRSSTSTVRPGEVKPGQVLTAP